MLRRRSPVARFVIVMLLLLAAMLTSALGIVDYLSARATLKNQLLSNARVQSNQLALSLALPVWNFDHPQIEKIIESEMQDAHVDDIILTIVDRSSPSGLRVIGMERSGDAVQLIAHDASPKNDL